MKVLLFIAFLFFPVVAFAEPPSASFSPDGPIMFFSGDNGKRQSPAPLSADDFCKRYKNDCKSNKVIKKLKLTDETYRLLWEVNTEVNKSISFESDQTQYGKNEYWEYPTSGKGDCEDYVLEKRKRLIAAGVHPSSLSLVWVKFMWSDHAVLMVRTDRGDFILDDTSPEVMGWDWKSYVYVARQYDGDPKLWIDMNNVDPNPLGRLFKVLVF